MWFPAGHTPKLRAAGRDEAEARYEPSGSETSIVPAPLHSGHSVPSFALPLPPHIVQVSLGTASGQTLSRAAEAVRELLREVLRSYVSP